MGGMGARRWTLEVGRWKTNFEAGYGASGRPSRVVPQRLNVERPTSNVLASPHAPSRKRP